ncbi:MAG: hypothetical protein V3V08_14975 [Nannocystaceae bacterium]
MLVDRGLDSGDAALGVAAHGTTLPEMWKALTVPLEGLLAFLSFSERSAPHATLCVGFIFMCMYLLRTAHMQSGTRSFANHALVTSFTVLPSFLVAALLLWAGYNHPDRTVVNLGWAAGTYVAWGLGGAMTRLARPDTEGADIGWLIQMAVVPGVAGVVAIVIFR